MCYYSNCRCIHRHTATCCNTLHNSATRCNALQHTENHSTQCVINRIAGVYPCTRQRTATHCNILQHTATHCNTAPHVATHSPNRRYIRRHTATYCNTLQHNATHCNTLQQNATHCNTLQHTATHCNTLQHTASPSTQCIRTRVTGLHTGTLRAHYTFSPPCVAICLFIHRHLREHLLFSLLCVAMCLCISCAVHCNAAQHTATRTRYPGTPRGYVTFSLSCVAMCLCISCTAHCNAMQHTATRTRSLFHVLPCACVSNGVATISRLLKIIGLFCRISSL